VVVICALTFDLHSRFSYYAELYRFSLRGHQQEKACQFRYFTYNELSSAMSMDDWKSPALQNYGVSKSLIATEQALLALKVWVVMRHDSFEQYLKADFSLHQFENKKVRCKSVCPMGRHQHDVVSRSYFSAPQNKRLGKVDQVKFRCQ
jgi:hypothetical protein